MIHLDPFHIMAITQIMIKLKLSYKTIEVQLNEEKKK